MYVIYALIDPRDNKPRYVGQAKNIRERFIQHLRCEGNNSDKNAWMDEMLSSGLLPVCQTLEVVHTSDDADEREVYWIRHYGRLKMPLVNIQHTTPFRYQERIKQLNAPSRKAHTRLSSSEVKTKIKYLLECKIPDRKIAEQVGLSGRNYIIYKQLRDEILQGQEA